MVMKMIAESAKWCSRQMAGISAKFSHITLGTIFGTFQPATVGCCQKVQLCSNSNNTNRILWSAKSGWKFRLLWSQRASIAWQGKSRVVDDCSSPILADWSFPRLPDYIFSQTDFWRRCSFRGIDCRISPRFAPPRVFSRGEYWTADIPATTPRLEKLGTLSFFLLLIPFSSYLRK